MPIDHRLLHHILAIAGATGDPEQEQSLARHLESEGDAEGLILVGHVVLPVEKHQPPYQTQDRSDLLYLISHGIDPTPSLRPTSTG